jgi:hypothetical protein
MQRRGRLEDLSIDAKIAIQYIVLSETGCKSVGWIDVNQDWGF